MLQTPTYYFYNNVLHSPIQGYNPCAFMDYENDISREKIQSRKEEQLKGSAVGGEPEELEEVKEQRELTGVLSALNGSID